MLIECRIIICIMDSVCAVIYLRIRLKVQFILFLYSMYWFVNHIQYMNTNVNYTHFCKLWEYILNTFTLALVIPTFFQEYSVDAKKAHCWASHIFFILIILTWEILCVELSFDISLWVRESWTHLLFTFFFFQCLHKTLSIHFNIGAV